MASLVFSAGNYAMATTAAPAAVALTTAIRTLMQIASHAAIGFEVVEWGISFDGSAAATPGKVELVDTVAIPATSLTAYNAADIVKVSQVGTRASTVQLGTALSGWYTASAEGTIVATRNFDIQYLPPTAPYIKQFPLERGPTVLLAEFLRVRAHMSAAVNALCYIVWAE